MLSDASRSRATKELSSVRKGIRSYGLFKKYRVSGQYHFGPDLVCLRHTVLETTKMTKFDHL